MKQGLLLIDKPEDWTSFDVVNYVRRIVALSENKKPKNVKVGHSGTLDPFATGLLILLVGKDYTRQASTYTKKDKTYDFSIHLGATSTTGDKTGEISSVSNREPSKSEIEAVIPKFTGEIKQTPPQYSAIKINGKKAYELARSGQIVELEPRHVTIYSLELIDYAYPEAKLRAKASSGTYIRSLSEDIGTSLGVGAYTVTLRRDTIGDYDVKDASQPKDLNQTNLEQFIKTDESE